MMGGSISDIPVLLPRQGAHNQPYNPAFLCPGNCCRTLGNDDDNTMFCCDVNRIPVGLARIDGWDGWMHGLIVLAQNGGYLHGALRRDRGGQDDRRGFRGKK